MFLGSDTEIQRQEQSKGNSKDKDKSNGKVNDPRSAPKNGAGPGHYFKNRYFQNRYFKKLCFPSDDTGAHFQGAAGAGDGF